MNLLDLTVRARTSVDRYRYPEISEWRSAITPVLHALGYTYFGTSWDVEDITIHGNAVSIIVSCPNGEYTDRCDMAIPLSILTSSNPEREAKKISLANALERAKDSLWRTQKELESIEGNIQKLTEQLNRLQASE